MIKLNRTKLGLRKGNNSSEDSFVRSYPSLTERADHYNLERAATQGMLLPKSSAVALEDALLTNEFDLINRARLLGYYSHAKTKIDPHEKGLARLRHMLWFIENAPGCKFSGDEYFALNKGKHPSYYAQVKAAWLRQIDVNAHPHIKINAALFFFNSEPHLATKLADSILSADSTNKWAKRILNELGHKNIDTKIVAPTAPENLDLRAWRSIADSLHLDNLFNEGKKMPALSARTLETIVEKDPEDISARAELMGYYHSRWKRANLFKVDPEYLAALTENILWCIEFVPGSKFVGSWYRYGIDRRLAPYEHAQIERSWTSKIKLCSDNPAILASAAAFFINSGKSRRAAQLVARAQELCDGDAGVSSILCYGVENSRPKKKQEALLPAQLRSAIERVSLNNDLIAASPNFSQYDLAEWSTEVNLAGVRLNGRGIPAASIANLEQILSQEHLDIYNRAKLIGFYYGAALTDSQRKAQLRHMIWFIENLPQSRFIATFALETLKSQDLPSFSELKKLLLKKAKENRDDVEILINVAVVLSRIAPEESRRLSKLLLKKAPSWGRRIQMLLGDTLPDLRAAPVLRAHGFKPGERSTSLTKIAKELDILRHALFGMSLPKRSLWSNERALQKNPNDLVLRAEAVGAYYGLDELSPYFHGTNPDFVPFVLKHNLWLIQFIPACYIYIGSNLSTFSVRVVPRRAIIHNLESHSILLAAAKLQMKAYPTNIEICLSVLHYFPLGFERAAISILRKLGKEHPANKRIKERLAQLASTTPMKP